MLHMTYMTLEEDWNPQGALFPLQLIGKPSKTSKAWKVATLKWCWVPPGRSKGLAKKRYLLASGRMNPFRIGRTCFFLKSHIPFIPLHLKQTQMAMAKGKVDETPWFLRPLLFQNPKPKDPSSTSLLLRNARPIRGAVRVIWTVEESADVTWEQRSHYCKNQRELKTKD